MMHAMNDNEASVLSFPYQIVDWEEDMTFEQVTFQTRLRISNFLNKVAAGERYMTSEVVRIINGYNEIAIRHGYARIEYEHLMA